MASSMDRGEVEVEMGGGRGPGEAAGQRGPVRSEDVLTEASSSRSEDLTQFDWATAAAEAVAEAEEAEAARLRRQLRPLLGPDRTAALDAVLGLAQHVRVLQHTVQIRADQLRLHVPEGLAAAVAAGSFWDVGVSVPAGPREPAVSGEQRRGAARPQRPGQAPTGDADWLAARLGEMERAVGRMERRLGRESRVSVRVERCGPPPSLDAVLTSEALPLRQPSRAAAPKPRSSAPNLQPSASQP